MCNMISKEISELLNISSDISETKYLQLDLTFDWNKIDELFTESGERY